MAGKQRDKTAGKDRGRTPNAPGASKVGGAVKRITVGGVVLLAAYYFISAFDWKTFGAFVMDLLRALVEQNGPLAALALFVIVTIFGYNLWLNKSIIDSKDMEIKRHVEEKKALMQLLGVRPPSSTATEEEQE